MGEYDNDLNALTGHHDPAGVPERGFAELPDGEYQCRLDKIYLSTSKEKKTLMTVMEFEVHSGPMASRRIWNYSPMVDSKQLDRLTNDLRTLGMPANFKWNQIEQAFPSFLDNFYLVRIVTPAPKEGQQPRTYRNIIKRLSSDEVMQGSAVKGTGGKDVPF